MSTEVEISEKIKITVSEPKRWKVILLNDDTTPMEFVIILLMSVFKHSQEAATDITMQIHNEGAGVAGIYNFEIAEQKAMDATQLARTASHPLVIKVEEM